MSGQNDCVVFCDVNNAHTNLDDREHKTFSRNLAILETPTLDRKIVIKICMTACAFYFSRLVYECKSKFLDTTDPFRKFNCSSLVVYRALSSFIQYVVLMKICKFYKVSKALLFILRLDENNHK